MCLGCDGNNKPELLMIVNLKTSFVMAVCVAVLSSAAAAQSPGNDSLAAEVARLRREVEQLKTTTERQNERLVELDERGAQAAAPAAKDSVKRTISSTRGIYGKPFVAKFGNHTALGGYVDFEYKNNFDKHTSVFDQHRLIPFIFSEITDKLHFGTEIEFEHSTRIEVEDGEAEGGGAIEVEFATLDYAINEAFNVRGGLLLSPLGRFNLVHDSPINELTDRPLMHRDIIPTTLSEPGFGFFGTLYPSDRSLLSYEAYLVNGFTGDIVGKDGIRVRGGRSIADSENNNAKSFVGRVAFSPFLGFEAGASAHTGAYSSNGDGFKGDERLTIAALDATIQRGPFELLGEYSLLNADLPAALRAAGMADAQSGMYVQTNIHFGSGVIAPKATSVFTGVARFDRVDFARDADGDTRERFTLGINWRPVGEAVLKADFQWNWATAALSSDRKAGDRALRLSMASYF